MISLTVIYGVLTVVLVFGGLIFFHELGHFLAARSFGIGVRTFSLGFGPVLVSRTFGNTKYQWALLPLGGYVSIVGESADAEIEAPFTAKESFSLRPAWQRFIVIAAGAVFNLILAWLICWGVAVVHGKTEILPKVGTVEVGSPAEQAGLRKGDLILAVDGTTLRVWEEFSPQVQKGRGASVKIEVERDGARVKLEVVPQVRTAKTLWGEEIQRWTVGVYPAGEVRTVPLNFAEASVEGMKSAGRMIHLTWKFLEGLFVQTVKVQDLSGPVGVVTVIYDNSVSLTATLLLAAAISVNLGVVNLLPIPVLDGGHLLFLLLEMIFRRPLPVRVQNYAMILGLCFLCTLMVATVVFDVGRMMGP